MNRWPCVPYEEVKPVIQRLGSLSFKIEKKKMLRCEMDDQAYLFLGLLLLIGLTGNNTSKLHYLSTVGVCAARLLWLLKIMWEEGSPLLGSLGGGSHRSSAGLPRA